MRNREAKGPISNVFATSHVTVNLLLSATSQNLYEWGLGADLPAFAAEGVEDP